MNPSLWLGSPSYHSTIVQGQFVGNRGQALTPCGISARCTSINGRKCLIPVYVEPRSVTVRSQMTPASTAVVAATPQTKG
jgi:hypothetical protein